MVSNTLDNMPFIYSHTRVRELLLTFSTWYKVWEDFFFLISAYKGTHFLNNFAYTKALIWLSRALDLRIHSFNRWSTKMFKTKFLYSVRFQSHWNEESVLQKSKMKYKVPWREDQNPRIQGDQSFLFRGRGGVGWELEQTPGSGVEPSY